MFTPTTPHLAVDIIIRLHDDRIVLIERRFDPPGWAIPGGFVEVNETVAEAARREAAEETCLQVELIEQFHCYSDPKRDPRFHNVSVVFLANAIGIPVGADDARQARSFALDDLPALAFDHEQILADYRRFLATGKRPPVAQ